MTDILEEYRKHITYPLKRFSEKENDGVYIMYNHITKLFKIGITEYMHERRLQLSNQCGVDLDMVMYILLEQNYDEPSIQIEKFLKQFYKHKKQKGEWFNLTVRDIIDIRNLFYLIEGYGVVENIRELIDKYK